MSSTERNKRKHVVGQVTSNKPDKTVVVKADRLVKHPRYKKYVTRSSKYYVHDEKNEALLGDTVEIAETRPLSKLKRWRLVRVMSRVAGAEDAAMSGEASAT